MKITDKMREIYIKNICQKYNGDVDKIIESGMTIEKYWENKELNDFYLKGE